MLQVEIYVKGQINEDWSEWFEGLIVNHVPGDQTLLSGQLSDQAALYSLIARLSRLGLPLVSVDVSERSSEVPEDDCSRPEEG
jgi:hypothetical protein